MSVGEWDAEAKALREMDISLAAGDQPAQEYTWGDLITVLVSLASTTFGISALGLPGVLVRGGWAMFLCLVAFSAYANFHASACMIEFADRYRLTDFGTFSRAVYGDRWAGLSNLLFSAYNAGIAVVSLVYLNNALADLSRQAGVAPLLCDPQQLFWLAVCCVAALPVLARPRLSQITAITSMTLLAMLLLLVLLLRWDLAPSPDTLTTLKGLPVARPAQFTAVFFFSTYIFSYESNIVGIYAELPGRTPVKMRRILTAHSVLFFVYYAAVGFAGAALFRFDARLETTDLLELFPRQHSLVVVVSVLMALSTFVTFVCAFKPCKEALLHQLSRQGQGEEAMRLGPRAGWAATAGTLATLMLIAAALANSGVNFMGVIDVIALVFAPAVTLVGPILAYARQHQRPQSWALLALLGSCLFFGLTTRALSAFKDYTH